MRQSFSALLVIKVVHTIVWAVMAASILAIPILVWLDIWLPVAVLTVLVLAECVVLFLNQMRCPLTDVAARYTDDRSDNFDIFLPVWLARHNKLIFGTMFAGVLLFTLARMLV